MTRTEPGPVSPRSSGFWGPRHPPAHPSYLSHCQGGGCPHPPPIVPGKVTARAELSEGSGAANNESRRHGAQPGPPTPPAPLPAASCPPKLALEGALLAAPNRGESEVRRDSIPCAAAVTTSPRTNFGRGWWRWGGGWGPTKANKDGTRGTQRWDPLVALFLPSPSPPVSLPHYPPYPPRCPVGRTQWGVGGAFPGAPRTALTISGSGAGQRVGGLQGGVGGRGGPGERERVRLQLLHQEGAGHGGAGPEPSALDSSGTGTATGPGTGTGPARGGPRPRAALRAGGAGCEERGAECEGRAAGRRRRGG